MKQLIYQIGLTLEKALPFELVWRVEKDDTFIYFKGRITNTTYLTFIREVEDLPEPAPRLKTALELEQIKLQVNVEPWLYQEEVDEETIRKNRERIDWLLMEREQQQEMERRVKNSAQTPQYFEETIKLAA